jgi:hypothetical protein
MKTTAILAAVLFLSACATPYQDISTDVRGGFYTERISENHFAVSFSGNGFTAPRRARDLCILRAAELTLEYNYSFFTIDGQRNLSRVSQIDMGSTTTTNGFVSPYGGFSATSTTSDTQIPVFKPGTRLFITCYDSIPSDPHLGRIFDARQVAADLRAKYGIKN